MQKRAAVQRETGDGSNMHHRARTRIHRATSLICVSIAGVLLASCASQTPKAKLATGKSKEYFSEAEYGVKASPLVAEKRSRMPRGGGREQIGKAYKVKGKWYKPKEDPDYVKVGAASWYGDAFHGRLTANGEVYDMTHLTAAHPTMPLPSYARVTNTKNGSSVIVRVNDRGPFANDRIIDLSKKAAEMLDYTHAGVAKVKVEYVGRAPLHGQDDAYLLASYIPPAGISDPSTPPDVMIAMNGPTPSATVGAPAVVFPGQLQTVAAPTLVASIGDLELPSVGPAIPERPVDGLDLPVSVASLSYADTRVARASGAFDAFAAGLTPAQIVASFERSQAAAPATASEAYVAVGTFEDRGQAEAMARELGAAGKPAIAAEPADGVDWYTVTLHADGRQDLDALLRSAWAAGATEAMVVRD
jgi:rare lipoprotein A